MRKANPLVNPANLVRNGLFVLTLGVLATSLFELLRGGDWSILWKPTALGVVTFVLLVALSSPRVWHWLTGGREIIDFRIVDNPKPARGLVALVSQGQGRSGARDAAWYHGETLEHLWLVTSTAAQTDAEWVQQQVRPRCPNAHFHPVVFIDDAYDIEHCRVKVDEIRNEALALRRFTEDDLICDFTGLTKEASAGMILACAHREARLEYMHPRARDQNGRPDFTQGPSLPVEIQIAYQVEKQG